MRTSATYLLIILMLALSSCSDDGTSPTDPGGQDDPTAPTTYQVTYHANGADSGTAPADTVHYEAGDMVTLADPGTLTRADHTFTGWNTLADGSGTDHAAGATLAMPAADLDLHAVWQEDQTGPVGWDPTLGSWAYLGDGAGAASAGEAVKHCRLTVNPSGLPVAAYTLDSPALDQPRQQVVLWSGSSFVDLGGSEVLGHATRTFLDVECDADGRIWIGSTNSDDNGVIYSYADGTWNSPTVFTNDGSTYQVAMTLDSAGRPVMAYRYRPDGSTLLGVSRWDGTAWQPYPDLQTSLDNNLALAMIDDRPHVIYADGMQYGHAVRHDATDGWQNLGDDPMHPSNAFNSHAMTVDSQGRPWVIFRQGGDVHVTYLDGGAWVAVDTDVLDDTTDTSSWPASMDIVFVDEVPVITYERDASPRGIQVLALTEAGWVPLAGVDTVGAQGSEHPQLAVLPDGRLALIHSDADAGGALSMQVYTPAD